LRAHQVIAVDTRNIREVAVTRLARTIDAGRFQRVLMASYVEYLAPLWAGALRRKAKRGVVIGAVIHDPVGDDSALALRGEGAWTESPDGRRQGLRVAAPVPVAEMTGIASWRYLPPGPRATLCRNLPRVAACWDYRCAGHEYRLLAGGQCHFLLFNRLWPWDHAPGWLLHREAGGYAARFDGRPYSPTVTTGGLICAPDAASWQALRSALLDD